jgi:diguanylate cyclase (GGDEF)-like protein/PAS domain S-box-containing protein
MEDQKNGRQAEPWWSSVLVIGFPGIACLALLAFWLSPYRESWPWPQEHLHALILSGGAFLAVCSTLSFMLLRQVKTCEKLKYQLRLHQKIIENTKEAVIVTDAEAVILDVNKAYTEITGYEPKEVVGGNPRIGQSGRHDRAFYEAMWHQLSEVGKWSGEIWDRRKNGEVYLKCLTINAIRDDTGATINHIGIFTDLTEERSVEKQLKNLLFYDPLTMLPNRTLFEEVLTLALVNSQYRNIPLALLCIDLNRFKNVNDSLGYKAGDDLLVQVADRIKGGVRTTDTVSRLCGGEFMVVLSEITLEETVGDLVRHLLHLLGRPFCLSGEKVFIEAGIGISIYPKDGRDAETLMRNADTAMTVAKKREGGGEKYQYFRAQMNENLVYRITLEKQLRHALEDGEFALYYQPKYSLATERIVGMEALIRWLHPEEGVIPPAEFIPVAEETNLILALGEWGLKEACRQVKRWEKEGAGLYPIAVNLSSRQFQDKRLLTLVVDILDETGLKPELLELEITESTVMEDPDEAAKLLREIRQLGVRIAVDDFGTGYSSLAYLKKFPINTLKIDQTFVADITCDVDDAAIVDSIISMADTLNLKVVVEGVETGKQVDFFKARRCHEAQGYYFSRPLPPEKFAELIRNEEQIIS